MYLNTFNNVCNFKRDVRSTKLKLLTLLYQPQAKVLPGEIFASILIIYAKNNH